MLTTIPRDCCGGGVGHKLRIEVSEAITLKRLQDFRENADFYKNLQNHSNFITTFCPDAYWILKVYGRKQRIAFKLREMCFKHSLELR